MTVFASAVVSRDRVGARLSKKRTSPSQTMRISDAGTPSVDNVSSSARSGQVQVQVVLPGAALQQAAPVLGIAPQGSSTSTVPSISRPSGLGDMAASGPSGPRDNSALRPSSPGDHAGAPPRAPLTTRDRLARVATPSEVAELNNAGTERVIRAFLDSMAQVRD